ncbi:hypothetical protein DRO26_00185 [Candidatus Bathyarchaeota archaeon]|nr:MAG: hypothetical protein DRO26_00185 [Candidatus Bathyarchaeota archaeon]
MSVTYKTGCPVCGNPEITINQVSQDIPHFGPAIILSILCPSCGFKDNDVILVKTQEPKTYSLKVETLEDLKAKIVRSSTCLVKIPELGVEIKPGPASQGFITNVEGLLERVEEALKALTMDKNVRNKCSEFFFKLQLAKEGKKSFTVILKDPSGNSAIIPSQEGKVKVKRMSKKEVEALQKF